MGSAPLRKILARAGGVALVFGAAGSAALAGDPPETAIKAGYLTKFAPFIDWPARSFATGDSPLRICITGADPFGPALVDAVRGQQVQGHPVMVDHPDAAAIGQCQILFVGAGSETADRLRAAEGHPVLTVTDRGQGVSGGMIEFVQIEGRVRFAIDAAAAGQSGIQISSKLLELAVKVER